MNPLSLLTGPAPALLLLASQESSGDPEVSTFGPILSVVGILFGAVLLVIAVAVGARTWTEHRRLKRARIADIAAHVVAIRARHEATAAVEERRLVGGSGPQPRHSL